MKTTQLLFLVFFEVLSNFQSISAQTTTVAVTSYGSTAGLTTALNSGSSFYGYQTGNAISPTTSNARNSFFGAKAGSNITTGTLNTLIGFSAGMGGILTSYNSYVGAYSGQNNLGASNVGIGLYALSTNSGINSAYNTALGNNAGNQINGNFNIFLGSYSGAGSVGNYNIAIGSNTGSNVIGSGNILLGQSIGSGTISDKLMIDNTSTSTPLIWGDFLQDQVKLNGKVGIGAVGSFPTMAGGVDVNAYRLFVTGGILADEVRVMLSASGTWPDYVFYKDYDLKPLAEVEKFINEKGHLPNVPSAAQVKEDGIALGEMAKIQQEKIEELTLYLIQQGKEIEALKAAIKLLADKK